MNRTLGTALLGGGVGGLLDVIYAIVLWGVILGGSPTGILQSIASGLLGKAAYEGGAGTALCDPAATVDFSEYVALVVRR